MPAFLKLIGVGVLAGAGLVDPAMNLCELRRSVFHLPNQECAASTMHRHAMRHPRDFIKLFPAAEPRGPMALQWARVLAVTSRDWGLAGEQRQASAGRWRNLPAAWPRMG